MLNQDQLRIAIIMCKRASCSGEEAMGAALTIRALENEYNILEADKNAELPKTPEADAEE